MDKLIVIPVIFTLLAGGFWLWMTWDLGGNDHLSGREKFYWQVAFLFERLRCRFLYS